MRNIYSVIKDCDPHIKFAFLTGVSKFSKVSLFSGLNNLRDVSLNPRYATLCGYTDKEIKAVFNGHLDGVDFALLAEWYNGYNFLENLLFQTGYLTIDRVEELGGERFYYLTYPNRVVKASLNSYLLR